MVATLLLHLAVVCTAAAAPHGTKWKSVGEPIQEQVSNVVEWEKEATAAAASAGADAQKVQEASVKASGSLTNVLAEVGSAKAAMNQARTEEKQIAALRDRLWQKAKETAMAEIPKMLPALREKAQTVADATAKKEAKLFKKSMKKKARTEGAQASKVYTDVMNGAGQTAAEYAKLGDGLISQSATLQMNAGLAQGQANQFTRVGDVGEAQKLMQQSRGDMNTALGLNAQATGMYDTANKITAQLPSYANEAAVAGYHAQVMYDPEAQAPPPALVLAQQKKRFMGAMK